MSCPLRFEESPPIGLTPAGKGAEDDADARREREDRQGVPLQGVLEPASNAAGRIEERLSATLAGDRDDANAPTYASFAAVSSLPSGEHPAASGVGDAVNQSIDRAGVGEAGSVVAELAKDAGAGQRAQSRVAG